MTEFNVDPTSVSFDEIKADLKAYLDTKPDAAKWKDFFDSQVGTTVVELISGLGTMLKYDAIVSRREAFPKYAENRSSVVAYAESVGYSHYRGRNAVLKLTVIPNFTGVLTKFQIIGAVKDQDLVLLADTTVNSGVSQDIYAVIGLLQTESLVADKTSPSSFRFTQPKVSQDLRVKLNTTEVLTSVCILDLLNEKWVVQSNVFGSVDVMYLNLDSFVTQFNTGDTINLEYVALKNLEFLNSDISFNYGSISTIVIDSVFKDPEDTESIRINSPLYNEAQYTIRGRDDYSKVFRLIDSTIKDTNYKDISPAVVELYAVRDDLSFFSPFEKLSFIAQLSSFRPMGLVPPTIADPEIVFLDIGITMVLQGTNINPVNVARAAVQIYEQKLNIAIDFNNIEETIEDNDNVKVARIKLRGTPWQANTRYVRGAFVQAIPDNGKVYEMTKVLYFSGPTQPVFPGTLGDTVIDNDLVWTACSIKGLCDDPSEWQANTAYDVGAQVEPTPSNGFIYCLTSQRNLSNSSIEVQHIGFSAIPAAGTWRLEFGTEETVDFAFNASNSTVQAGLNALLGLSDVVVTGNYSAGFDVVFAGVDSNKPQPTLQLTSTGQNEINCIYEDLVPNIGNFKLEFDGQQTGFLAYNTTNAALKTALEALTTIGVGNVDVVDGTGGEKYRVIFQGALGSQDLSNSLTLVSNTMTSATTVVPTISTPTPGVAPNSGTNEKQRIVFSQVPTTGTWSVDFNGNTTATLNYNDSAATVQSALEALPSVGSSNVFVSGDYTNGFLVEFKLALGAQDVVLMTIPLNTLFNGLVAVNIAVQTPIPGVLPFAGTNEVQLIEFPFVPDSGSFTLQFGPETTAAILFSDVAINVQNALNALVGLSAVTVTGNFTIGFTVTFTGANGLQNQPLLLATNNTLGASSAPVTLDIQVCQEGERAANSLEDASLPTPVPVTVIVTTTTDGSDPEPDWANAVGIESIC